VAVKCAIPSIIESMAKRIVALKVCLRSHVLEWRAVSLVKSICHSGQLFGPIFFCVVSPRSLYRVVRNDTLILVKFLIINPRAPYSNLLELSPF